jgi:hypothetical protein
LVTITEIKFSAALAWVKAKTLSGSGQVSRVRLGYGSGNRVKAFSLSGGDRFSRVRPLPLNPDRVNFQFLKSFINSNHFDPNSNLNYE